MIKPRLSSSVLPPTLRARLDPSSSSSSGRAAGVEVVQGWLKSVRAHKNVVFAELSDGSTAAGLQAVFKGKARTEGYVPTSLSLLLHLADPVGTGWTPVRVSG